MALTTRRALLQLAESLGEKVRPVLYEVDLSTGALAGRGTLKLDQSDGPLVVCELLDGLVTVTGGVLQLALGGREYTVGSGVRRSALLLGASNQEGLPAPIVLPTSAALAFGLTADSATIGAGSFIGVAGYHVSPALAQAVQRQGELWSVLLDVTDTPPLVAPTITDPTMLLQFVRDSIDAAGTVSVFDISIGNTKLFPGGVLNTGLLPTSLYAFGSALGIPVAANSNLSLRQVASGGLRTRITVFGRRVYVAG